MRSSASACCSLDSVTECTVGAAAGGADRELAPAGADLEHPGARADAGLVEQPVDLAALGLRERPAAGVERRRRLQVVPRSTRTGSNSAEE